jgi:hypothetical protein
MVATDDGRARVDIPPGALPADTTITISPNTAAPTPAGATVVGTPFTFGPDGLKFLKPITITLAFDGTKLPAETTANAIVVYTAPDGSSVYEPLPTSVADATHVAATTTHFSTDVAGVGAKAATGLDASAPLSICAQGGSHCGSTSGPGCGASTPTCQSASLCASYPGSTVQSCTADSSGADAICCFPAGAPTCFHAGAGCGGQGCNPPKCATSNPCGTYPGATMQSCTDVSGGYDAVCCLPAGTPLPGTTTSGGTTDGGAGGKDGGDTCSLACHGSSNGTCGCSTTCNGHVYDMTCNGSTCACTEDASSTGSFAQAGTCGGSSSTEQGFVSGCGYPGTVSGGGPTDAGSTDAGSTDAGSADAGSSDGGKAGTDAGTGGCSGVTCGGNASGCSCSETCNGHTYTMTCTTGANCVCDVDGVPGASSPTGTTCSSPQVVGAVFQSQCVPADAGTGG